MAFDRGEGRLLVSFTLADATRAASRGASNDARRGSVATMRLRTASRANRRRPAERARRCSLTSSVVPKAARAFENINRRPVETRETKLQKNQHKVLMTMCVSVQSRLRIGC
jgi:hypothetical protein